MSYLLYSLSQLYLTKSKTFLNNDDGELLGISFLSVKSVALYNALSRFTKSPFL